MQWQPSATSWWTSSASSCRLDSVLFSPVSPMTRPPGATDALAREVRLYVFGEAADAGRVPQPPEIAAALGRSQAEVERALRHLAAGKVLILAPNDGNIWAANPFCAVPSHSGLKLVEKRTGASVFGTRSALWRRWARTPSSERLAATVASRCCWRSQAGS